MTAPSPTGLETVTIAANEFEAAALVAVLREAGIEAFAFGAAQGGVGVYLTHGGLGVPVQVRAVDLERAKAALRQNVADSVDLDWDEVDVGQREDTLPLHTPGRMPPLARLSLALAIAIVLGSAAAAIIILVRALV